MSTSAAQQQEGELLRRLRYVRDALVTKLTKDSLALSGTDRRKGEFLYVLAAKLRGLDVEYREGANIVAATDGSRIIFGGLFEKTVKQLEQKKANAFEELAVFTMLHEAMHAIYGHPYREALASDKHMYNIVADLYVNTVLRDTLGLRVPKYFVTLDSLVKFVEAAYGGRLDEGAARAVRELGEHAVADKVSVEHAYNVLMRLPDDVREAIKREFGGAFFGRDIAGPNGEPMSDTSVRAGGQGGKGERSESSRQEGGGSGGGQRAAPRGGEDKGGQGRGEEGKRGTLISEGPAGAEGEECSFEGDARAGGELIRRLRALRELLERAKEELDIFIGEYSAMASMSSKGNEGGAGAGTEPGVGGTAEYRHMKALLIPVEVIFMTEAAEGGTDTRYTFAGFDRQVYWLPKVEDVARSAMALIDASPSVPPEHTVMFLNMIERAMKAYGISYDVVIFSTGELGHYRLSPQSMNAGYRRGVPRGLGTVFDESIARRVKEAATSGVRLIQILSDFWIEVSDSARAAFREFKAAGGRVSCYSTTGDFLDICDFRHTLPELPS